MAEARYVVFDTQAQAQAAVTFLNKRIRDYWTSQGYTVLADGSIVGRRQSDQTAAPTARTTTIWASPRQRKDGKWVIPHPESHPGYAAADTNGTPVWQSIMQDVAAATETWTAAWF